MGQKPIWLMRQAGRYLPEYMDIRQKIGGFVDLCMNPDMASEVTLQPIKRFDFDAAIIFSDILMIPYALGQKLWFETGEGPRLGDLNWHEFDAQKLQPVYDAITLTRQNLDDEKSLIGFAGAPWTLLLYTLQGRGGNDFVTARSMVYNDLENAKKLLKILEQSVIEHLSNQIKAGADVVQIFDSWAGLCPAQLQNDFLIDPVKNIVSALKKLHPDVTIIAFPKGYKDLNQYTKIIGNDVVGIDQFSHLTWVDKDIATQGNLDPLVLIQGGDVLEKAVLSILEKTENRAHIFNLGHGIDKTTPIAHVEQLVRFVKG